MHSHQVLGEDVIAIAGQNLTNTELKVLVGHAEGLSQSAIGAAINASSIALRGIEASIKAKLGATTHTHMIARAFILGVLIPRALCFLIAAANALDGSDTLRSRTAAHG